MTPPKTPRQRQPSKHTGILWNRQPNESPPAFAAFKVYRDMGSKRSIPKTAKVVKKQQSLIGRWSSAYEWVMRATEYDNYIEAQQASLQELKIEGEAEKWAARQTVIREKSWELSEKLLAKAERMLKYPITRKKKTSKDGKQIIIIQPQKWGFNTVSDLIELANKLGRQSAEMPTEIIEFLGILESKGLPQNEVFGKLNKQFADVPKRDNKAD